MSDCVFCSLVSQTPKNKVVDNDSFVALFDVNPVSQGHVIIIPKKHTESVFDLNDTDFVRLQRMLGDIKNKIQEKVKPDGYNIGINDGEAAGATQKHIIIHVIPRYKGDVPNPAGGVRNILGIPMMEPQKEIVKEEPKPQPKEEKKVEIKKEEPKPKTRTWDDVLTDAIKRRKEIEKTQIRNKE